MGATFRLNKGIIAKYIRGECRRRLRLDLYAGAKEREDADAPDKQSGRPGLRLISDQGREYERKCFASLEDIFSAERVRHGAIKLHQRDETEAFGEIELRHCMAHLSVPGNFVLEAQYPVLMPFMSAHGLQDICADGAVPGLLFGENRPDILLAQAPTGESRRVVSVAGEILTIPAEDGRIGLRVMDVKLTSEPSPAHFAELAYYGMTLSAWLEANEYGEQFVVLADAAIWPGSHEGSSIRAKQAIDRGRGILVTDPDEYYEVLDRDLETMPAEVILGRVVRFLRYDLREAMSGDDWSALPYHIDGRCIGCDYLGYNWKAWKVDGDPVPLPDPRLCWPTAERDEHLSRLAGLTEGACGKLEMEGVKGIPDLSKVSAANKVFDTHQALRASRHIVHARANALQSGLPANLPERSGSSAVMPAFSDIRVAISVDYDVGSGFAFALGYHLEALVPTGVLRDAAENPITGSGGKPRMTYRMERRARQMLVHQKSLDGEGETFKEFLTRLQVDIFNVRDEIASGRVKYAADKKPYKPRIQFYLWDMLNFEQLRRMMGRHLMRVKETIQVGEKSVDPSPIAWIFPPEQVLQEADHVDRGSSLTIVGEMVRLLAADIPHHYGQIAIANAYRVPPADGKKPYEFRVNSFYGDPLSDLIPSERGHEVWNNSSPFLSMTSDEYREHLRQAIGERLSATMSVVNRLRHDFEKSPDTKLSASAPTVESVFGHGKPLNKVAQDTHLIYQHARLMDAAQELEIDLRMATPPFEREARFQSVRLERHYQGSDRDEELRRLGLGRRVDDFRLLAFKMSERSYEAKIKEGDFNLSLMPEDRLEWQHRIAAKIEEAFPALNLEDEQRYRPLRKLCKVTLVRFDRVKGTVIVEISDIVDQLIRIGAFDLDFRPGRFGILDALHTDFFVGPRLVPALQAIGAPRISRDEPLIDSGKLLRGGTVRPHITATESTAAELIWSADRLASQVTRDDLTAGISTLSADVSKNDSQVAAIRAGLSRRLSLLWGPPGTGKSRTSAAMIVALVAQARAEGRNVRIAVTGPTWVAIDNVMKSLPTAFAGQDVALARLISSESGLEQVHENLRDYAVQLKRADEATTALIERLDERGVTIVGSTAHQLGKLVRLSDRPLPEFFDFMLVDEASQMDVAQACVAFTTLAPAASVVVVGDNKQMAPIHPIDPPVGAEHIVGSIYDFFFRYREGQRGRGGIQPTMLNVSYRSNKEIVEFVEATGYPGLRSDKPALRMQLASPIPPARPDGSDLPWSPDIARILDPEEPLTAIVHSDRFSSQRNEDEASLIASLVAALSGRLADETGRLLTGAKLFDEGIGIVTPHRAQQSAVIERLRSVLKPDPETLAAINRTVDTVERFQGQEKTVMLASFGLGDGDQIAMEEDFLYDFNRFNVIASRAKAKLVVIMSRRLADYLPRDLETLRGSWLLKHLVYGHLRTGTALSLPELPNLGACELRTR